MNSQNQFLLVCQSNASANPDSSNSSVRARMLGSVWWGDGFETGDVIDWSDVLNQSAPPPP